MIINLKAYFAIKGLSQKVVAGQLGISPPFLCKFLSGKSKLPIELRKKFCKIIGIDFKEYQKGIITNEQGQQ